ncbi:DUF3784 domain-containing protein [Clostridium sardiniense]|uniref:DUF3784 domain-containing protein n=1 Tax=Clostridium sardiniense TaxID=29369 RepID=A0ABS7KWY6_CLOSR|nr:DUF3784 domain-containing protein [Clostridium sardiniense]MBY0755324.1 DUF3784 domain-containing protein [Clostridium sardiniense]MDQ0459769.1 membrane-anchored protein YejM (alkaline phosphatase superfamily) [Clostridium sardiniense]
MNFFIVLNLIVGALAIFFGYKIKFKKRSIFINDYKIKNIIDEKSYLNWIGLVLLAFGLLIIVIALVTFLSKSVLIAAIIDTILIVALIILLIYGDKKYSK